MDEYGFGAAARAGLQMFEQCARQSGRTMRLIERVTENDQIVVMTQQEANRINALLREAGKPNTRVVVCSARDLSKLFAGRPPSGRTFYDHEWQRRWFEDALREAEHELETCQARTSKSWPEAPRQEEPMRARFEDWRS